MSKERIPYHPAFFQAIQAEFVDFQDVLSFEAEHVLNAEPLKVDILIIKKPDNLVITKNIGKIFKAVNIVEYKSRSDSISFEDYHKVCAYAHLYMALNGIPVTDITITFIASSYPRNLVSYLKKSCGYVIDKDSDGVYIIKGDVIKIQLIDSKNLPKNDNIWLSGLSNKIDANDLEHILQAKIKFKDKVNLDAYLKVIADANPEVLEEVLNMTKARARVQQILMESDIYEEIITQKLFEIADSMYADGDSIEKISRNINISIKILNEHFNLVE